MGEVREDEDGGGGCVELYALETESLQSEMMFLLFGGSTTKFTQGSSNSPDKDLASSVVLVNSPDFCLYSRARTTSAAPATLLATAPGSTWVGRTKYSLFLYLLSPLCFW